MVDVDQNIVLLIFKGVHVSSSTPNVDATHMLAKFPGGKVTVEKDDKSGIAVITLRHPERKNALSGKYKDLDRGEICRTSVALLDAILLMFYLLPLYDFMLYVHYTLLKFCLFLFVDLFCCCTSVCYRKNEISHCMLVNT